MHRWCVTCDGVAKFSCSPNTYECIEMASGFMKNQQRVMSLTGEYAEIRRQGEIKLAEAIEKKKEELQHNSLAIKKAHARFLECNRNSQGSQADLSFLLKTTEQWVPKESVPGSSQGNVATGNLFSQSLLTTTTSTSTVSIGSARVRYFYNFWLSEINQCFLLRLSQRQDEHPLPESDCEHQLTSKL